MKTQNVFGALLLIALSLPQLSIAQTESTTVSTNHEQGVATMKMAVCYQAGEKEDQCQLVDSGVAKCWQKFNNARPENPPPGSSFAISLEIGRAIGNCLFSEGFTQKVNPQVTSAEIIRHLGSLPLRSLVKFNSGVTSVLKRP